MTLPLMLLILIPVAAYLQLVLHELAHAIIPWICGYEVTIYPYPGERDGRFTFAYCAWHLPEGKSPMSADALGWTYLAPRVFDLVQLAIWVPLSFVFEGWASAIARTWVVVAATDFAYNTLRGVGEWPTTDAWRAANALGWDLRSVWWRVGGLLVACGVLGLGVAAAVH